MILIHEKLVLFTLKLAYKKIQWISTLLSKLNLTPNFNLKIHFLETYFKNFLKIPEYENHN